MRDKFDWMDILESPKYLLRESSAKAWFLPLVDRGVFTLKQYEALFGEVSTL